jgi:hypothetical protein
MYTRPLRRRTRPLGGGAQGAYRATSKNSVASLARVRRSPPPERTYTMTARSHSRSRARRKRRIRALDARHRNRTTPPKEKP